MSNLTGGCACGQARYTARMGDIVMVLTGTLDDPARVPPQMIVYA